MELKDFVIGGYFYTGAGYWKVADVGTRTVIAYRVRDLFNNLIPRTHGNWDEQDLMVFTDLDFGGCDLENRFTK
jgi:5S rRNA maturation endonuclease (ribonuclease M5)